MIFFQRQTSILGKSCQERLLKSKVLIAGVGGLGCVVAELLLRAGIDTLYLVDFAKVDLPDLNRQILYDSSDLGKFKTLVAAEKLKKIRPQGKVYACLKRIDEKFEPPEVDLIVDCLDNFSSRFILNEKAEKIGVSLVHAGINAYFGQITTITPGKTSSLREIFKGVKDEETVQATGSLCSVVGGLQAWEVIKVLCGLPGTLENRLLIVDIHDLSIEVIELK